MVDFARVLLGCLPVEEAAKMGFPAYKGSVKSRCGLCGCEIWLGPEQQGIYKKGGADLVCLKCVAAYTAQHGPVTVAKLTNKKPGE